MAFAVLQSRSGGGASVSTDGATEPTWVSPCELSPPPDPDPDEQERFSTAVDFDLTTHQFTATDD